MIPVRHLFPRRPRACLAAGLLALAAGLCVAPLRADDGQDRARAALAEGRILSLSRILAAIEEEIPGRVIEVDYEEEHGRPVYEIELLQPDGRLLELEVDARSGAILDRDYEDDD